MSRAARVTLSVGAYVAFIVLVNWLFIPENLIEGVTQWSTNSWMGTLYLANVIVGFVSNGEPVLHRGLDSVDVSEAGNIGDRLDYNHDIFATNPVVTEDMRQLLQTGTRPPDRRLPNLVAKTGASGASFWVYKRPE